MSTAPSEFAQPGRRHSRSGSAEIPDYRFDRGFPLWAKLITGIGLPTCMCVAMVYGIWRAACWGGEKATIATAWTAVNVVKPVVDKHIATVDALAANSVAQKESSEDQARSAEKMARAASVMAKAVSEQSDLLREIRDALKGHQVGEVPGDPEHAQPGGLE